MHTPSHRLSYVIASNLERLFGKLAGNINRRRPHAHIAIDLIIDRRCRVLLNMDGDTLGATLNKRAEQFGDVTRKAELT